MWQASIYRQPHSECSKREDSKAFKERASALPHVFLVCEPVSSFVYINQVCGSGTLLTSLPLTHARPASIETLGS